MFMSLFLFAATMSFAQYRTDKVYESLYDSETVSYFKKHVSYLSSDALAGRRACSEGERAAAGYLYEHLKKAGVDMLVPEYGDEFGIVQDGGDTLVSRNVYGFIQGYDRTLRDRYIVIGARMDNLGINEMTVDGKKVTQIYNGANGNASGMAMLIELAKKLSTNSIILRRSVIFIGFGASCNSYAGAWYFLNRAFKDTANIDAMINLDMLGLGTDGFYAFTSSNKDLNAMISRMEGELQPVHPVLTAAEPYPSDHRAFYSMEKPSVMFTTGKYPEHNTPKDIEDIIDYDSMEKELEYIYNFSVNLTNTEGPIYFRNPETPARGPAYDDVVPYFDCDQRPMFLNSADPRQFMEKWVYQYLRYPEEAVREGIQGNVIVDFIIGKDGNVTDVRVVRGQDPLLDEEALRVVKASPKWRPGRVNGQKVRTSMTISVEFRLEKKGTGKRFGIKK